MKKIIFILLALFFVGISDSHAYLSSTSADEVKKYCQGNKYDKDTCYWACSKLADSNPLSSEHAFEKNLCVETQCAKSDSKSDGKYMNACGSACSNIDDKNVKCVRREIEKYCRDSYDETRCGRFCAKATNKHELCKSKQYSKSYVESEDCNKYCNRTSKNFSDEVCKDKCGGMYDRYNSEEKNNELKESKKEIDNSSNIKLSEVKSENPPSEILQNENILANGAILKQENESSILEKSGYKVLLDDSLSVEVKDGVAYINEKEISVSPDVIAANAKSFGADVVKNIYIAQINNDYAYDVDIVKQKKMFGFFPIDVNSIVTYDLKDAKMINEKRSFKNKVFDWLSFD